MPFPSLWRTRSRPPGADQVIDLSDGAAARDLAGDGATDPAPAPEFGASGTLDAPTQVGADHGAAAEAGAAASRARAERRTRRFAAVIGFLSLRPTVGSSLTTAAAVGVAGTWLTGWVLLLSLTLAAVVGLISGGPLVRPDTFIDCWRLVHLMPIASGAGPVSLIPMLPAMLLFALVSKASSWLWSRSREHSEGWVAPVSAVAAMAAAYLVVAALIATSPTPGSTEGPFTQGMLALAGIVGAGAGLVLACGHVQYRYPRAWLLLQAAGTVLALLLAVSFLMVIVQLLVHWSGLWEMSQVLLSSGSLPASRFDAAALGAVQLAYLPNAVVWSAAYLLGAGFAVGEGTIVSPFSVTLGTMPEFPLTTLIPTAPLRWPWLPPLLIAIGSMLAGSVIRNAGLAKQMRTRLAVGAIVAFASAVGMAVLAAASNGGLGPGRLATVGPGVGVTLLATALVIGLGQLAWAVFPTVVADVGPFVDHARGTITAARGRGSVRLRRRRRKRQERA